MIATRYIGLFYADVQLRFNVHDHQMLGRLRARGRKEKQIRWFRILSSDLNNNNFMVLSCEKKKKKRASQIPAQGTEVSYTMSGAIRTVLTEAHADV